jgi:two-component system, OmpR family, response regulator RpaB
VYLVHCFALASAMNTNLKGSNLSSGLISNYSVGHSTGRSVSSGAESNHRGAAADELPNSEIRILVVDDERLMRDLMALSLRRLGYCVEAVADGPSALFLLNNQYFDLVMLDVVMAGMDGFTMLTELRGFSDVPVIMLTAMNRLEDIVRGFELGADNYSPKPFNFKEVEARIHAVLRRATHLLGGTAFDVATYGDLHLYHADQRVVVQGRPVDLTPTEFALLHYLAIRGERPTSKEELLQSVWGYSDSDNLNLVELAVRRLRTKIEVDPGQPARVVTVRGVGYKFVAHPEVAGVEPAG